MSNRYASFCSGIGGLDLAVEAVFGYPMAWHCEVAPEPASIHERHWPGIPNLGDITALNWADLDPVTLLCAGYPCQPFSHAGERRGEEDERHLWPYINEAVRVLRPRWVVLENVAGHLSLGFGTVLGDLAEAGYDAEWCCVRASDVGAPHGRLRVFILATDTASHQGRLSDGNGLSAAHADSSGGEARHGRPRTGNARRFQPVGGSDPADADTERSGRARRSRAQGWSEGRRTAASGAGQDLPHPDDTANDGERSRPEPRQGNQDAADADCQGIEGQGCGEQGRRGEPDSSGVDWGAYEPAVRRWERLTRPVPRPTDARGRLAPEFVEWMMGYPEGWTVGLNRPARLKALGNAVCPQQGILALSTLRQAWLERQAA